MIVSNASTFKALGDPVRLEMVERLAKVPEMLLADLVKNINMSRQGARKHLQVLADVGIVTLRTQGRETHIKLDTTSLASAKSFIASLEAQWTNRLHKLKDAVEHDFAK